MKLIKSGVPILLTSLLAIALSGCEYMLVGDDCDEDVWGSVCDDDDDVLGYTDADADGDGDADSDADGDGDADSDADADGDCPACDTDSACPTCTQCDACAQCDACSQCDACTQCVTCDSCDTEVPVDTEEPVDTEPVIPPTYWEQHGCAAADGSDPCQDAVCEGITGYEEKLAECVATADACDCTFIESCLTTMISCVDQTCVDADNHDVGGMIDCILEFSICIDPCE